MGYWDRDGNVTYTVDGAGRQVRLVDCHGAPVVEQGFMVVDGESGIVEVCSVEVDDVEWEPGDVPDDPGFTALTFCVTAVHPDDWTFTYSCEGFPDEVEWSDCTMVERVDSAVAECSTEVFSDSSKVLWSTGDMAWVRSDHEDRGGTGFPLSMYWADPWLVTGVWVRSGSLQNGSGTGQVMLSYGGREDDEEWLAVHPVPFFEADGVMKLPGRVHPVPVSVSRMEALEGPGTGKVWWLDTGAAVGDVVLFLLKDRYYRSAVGVVNGDLVESGHVPGWGRCHYPLVDVLWVEDDLDGSCAVKAGDTVGMEIPGILVVGDSEAVAVMGNEKWCE